MTKAILLLSGGLDCTLAGKILLEMGVEVLAVNYTSPFFTCTPKDHGGSAAISMAEQLRIPLKVIATGSEYLDVIKHSKHGRGSGVNPCLDCRIFILKQAAEIMREVGADFIATGEVIGQRPMSQRVKAMELIEKETGLEGYLLRPLCAKLLPPTVAEKEGKIDREKLLAIKGRCRKPQIQLAEDLGLKEYFSPGGGCLLTEKEFATRFRDLLDNEPDFGLPDARLLRYGRHFRLPSGAKVVVGRSQPENDPIERAARKGDAILLPLEFNGPSVLLRGSKDNADLKIAAELLAGYAKVGGTVSIEVRRNGSRESIQTLEGICGIAREAADPWRLSASKNKKTKR